MRSRTTSVLAYACAFGVLLALTAGRWASPNNYVLLAQAWLHGHSWIDVPGTWIDAVPFDGRSYVVEAPAPAVLLLPFVAIWGTATNQTIFAVAVGALCAPAALALGRNLGVPFGWNVFATVFLFFGTSLASSAADGGVWFVAHVCAVAFTLLALVELTGRKRALLIALWAVGALFSRYSLVLALPAYAALVCLERRSLRPLLEFGCVAVPAFALAAGYNFARWHDPFETGYAVWYRVMDPRAARDPHAFAFRHLRGQLRFFFHDGPKFAATFPWIEPRPYGVSFAWESSGFLAAFFARRPRSLVVAMALLSFACAVPTLLYYDSGGGQLGNRHALDFEPFLFVLLLAALNNVSARRIFAVLGTFSVLLGAWLSIVWSFYLR